MKIRSREIEKIIEGFEQCTVLPADFTHQSHLTVALSYLLQESLSEATVRFRTNILRFAAHYGLKAYHETITIFWLRLIYKFISERRDKINTPGLIEELLKELIEQYSSAKIIYQYYSKELLSSEKAKQEWIEPDLKPLDI
ncbi:MAG: hypothetical protein AB1489_26875 [Acidobacteriota bacterium]